MMIKYLKLVSLEPLPQGSHITFAYFGNHSVDIDILKSYLQQLEPFCLTKSEEDWFGVDKTIPVVKYSLDNDDKVQRIRKEIIQSSGIQIEKLNYIKWSPHLSNINVEDAPEYIKVVGIASNNDELFYRFK